MISRDAARLTGELFEVSFRKSYRQTTGAYTHYVDGEALYDFLYSNEYAAWFCNMGKYLRGDWRSSGSRPIKEFIMRLHTGETLAEVTKEWTWEQREKLGQQYLRELAEDILNYWAARTKGEDLAYAWKEYLKRAQMLQRQLELEGYIMRNGKLLPSEADVLDVQEETGVLQSLYRQLNLANEETTFHHVKLSEEHYQEGRWDDSISNSRKVLEAILQEVAAAHSERARRQGLAKDTFEQAASVRDYLEREGLLELKEKKAVASIYGLLSDTGGHPYMAQADQARLLRHLALTVSQFVMLRLQGSLKQVS